MFKYLASSYARRFEHPMLAFLLTIAGVLAAIGLALDMTGAFGLHGTVPAFFGVFAIFAGGLALSTYLAIFVAKRVSVMRDRAAPHRSDEAS